MIISTAGSACIGYIINTATANKLTFLLCCCGLQNYKASLSGVTHPQASALQTSNSTSEGCNSYDLWAAFSLLIMSFYDYLSSYLVQIIFELPPTHYLVLLALHCYTSGAVWRICNNILPTVLLICPHIILYRPNGSNSNALMHYGTAHGWYVPDNKSGMLYI